MNQRHSDGIISAYFGVAKMDAVGWSCSLVVENLSSMCEARIFISNATHTHTQKEERGISAYLEVAWIIFRDGVRLRRALGWCRIIEVSYAWRVTPAKSFLSNASLRSSLKKRERHIGGSKAILGDNLRC